MGKLCVEKDPDLEYIEKVDNEKNKNYKFQTKKSEKDDEEAEEYEFE